MPCLASAFARAAAESTGQPLWRYIGGVHAHVLPTPMMNILTVVPMQITRWISEVMIMPVGAENFTDAMRIGAEIFHSLKGLLHDAGLSTAGNDEGGFAPAINSTGEAIDYVMKAIEKGGMPPGDDVVLAFDAAATEFCKDGAYHLAGEGKTYSTAEMIDYWQDMAKRYPIVSIEDPLDEDDWDGFKAMTSNMGDAAIGRG